ncbi:DUF3918 family protein [Priestia iocasae]|uniref:DUF3918 domain-containing protein n=1 Tax=Priestia iocasae TaxID=2291674 RepID=A0ABS2QSB1_9BACI|nr:DUF3918 family protein [Metabacillus iocasae]MBM7701419.1 hypothetical protein [Metabacillus iocasae]
MNKIIPSMVAFGIGAYAYKVAEGRDLLTKRNMKRMRKRMMKTFR